MWHWLSVFLCSDVPTMPIVDKLKEALKPGRKDTGDEGDLNKLLASSAKNVLLQKIEFEPASKGFSYQLDSLKNKYVILNPRSEGAIGQRATEPALIKRQGEEFFFFFLLYILSFFCFFLIYRNLVLCFPSLSLRECGWESGRWDPSPAEDAFSREQANTQMGACVQGGGWPSQPGKHLLPQLHHSVSHLHPATGQLLAVKGAQSCLWVLYSFTLPSFCWTQCTSKHINCHV